MLEPFTYGLMTLNVLDAIITYVLTELKIGEEANPLMRRNLKAKLIVKGVLGSTAIYFAGATLENVVAQNSILNFTVQGIMLAMIVVYLSVIARSSYIYIKHKRRE